MTTVDEYGVVTVAGQNFSRAQVEDFLYVEADLLDAWQLDDWLALFVDGARYEIPTTDYRGWSLHDAGSFVDDDYDLLRARVKRLKSRKAHAENPHSRTHRMISNVRLAPGEDDTLVVKANFIVSRARDGHFDSYMGRYEHVLVSGADGLKFRLRRTLLVHESLQLGARLSFIL
jgi:p-cumate 2,3-dioxygenase beta subunit